MPITREVRSETRLADPGRYDLGVITAAEKLFIWRHRMKATNGRLLGRNGSAMSQVEAAAHLGIEYKRYNNLENGFRTGLSAEEVERLTAALEPLNLTVGELCFLARRRSGMPLTAIEKALGVSRPQFHELERGSMDIVQFWEDQGFFFPFRQR